MNSNKKFEEWLDSIPHGDFQKTKEDIIKRCGVTATVLRFWLYGKTKIPFLAQKEIEIIAGCKIFSEEEKDE